jgi:benzoate-CoA ligase
MFLRREDGWLEYAGRNDDMLKISGRWVSTLWVEQALSHAASQSVTQLACIGVPTPEGLTALFQQAAPGQQRSRQLLPPASMPCRPTAAELGALGRCLA